MLHIREMQEHPRLSVKVEGNEKAVLLPGLTSDATSKKSLNHITISKAIQLAFSRRQSRMRLKMLSAQVEQLCFEILEALL